MRSSSTGFLIGLVWLTSGADGPRCVAQPQWLGSLDVTRRPEPEKRQFAFRCDRVQTELAALGEHAWAGDYGLSLGFTARRLVLAPASGAVYEASGCTGISDVNYGPVRLLQDGWIAIRFELPVDGNEFPNATREYRPIRWGPRRYLVARDEFVSFCNAVNLGIEPRFGGTMVRRGDEYRAVDGLPEVPEEFDAYLLRSPIYATILSVVSETSVVDELGSPHEGKSRLVIDVGREDGVLPGMQEHVP